MPGGGKPIQECTSAEIRALLVAGSLIAAFIGIGSFWSQQPDWFLWPFRLACFSWLVVLWYQARRELRKRQQQPAEEKSI